MAISHDKKWVPKLLHSPNQHLIPPPTLLPDNIPFAPGKDLIVNIDVDDHGTHEMYLDDLIGLMIDLPNLDNQEQVECAPLLAIHTCARPLLNNEPIPKVR